MPNRVVREGIIKSELVDKLGFPAEVFYRRLMSVADDYGRYDGRSVILRADLFPLRADKIELDDIGDWKRECEACGLIKLYTVGGKQFLEVLNFNQRLRSMKSKYPPADDGNCPQMTDSRAQLPADDSKPRLETEAETESESEADVEGEGQPLSNFFDRGWMQYPRADMAIELTDGETGASVEWIYRLRQLTLTDSRINDFWKAFNLKLDGKKFYANRSDMVQHFREWLKTQKFDAPPADKSQGTNVAEQIRTARQKHKA